MLSFVKENFLKIKSALKATSKFFSEGLKDLFKEPWSEKSLDDLESLLYKTDMGSSLVEKFMNNLKKHPAPQSAFDLEKTLMSFGKQILDETPHFDLVFTHSPTVILIVGTNGSGKTTCCAKLAHRLKKSGKTVLLGAADTFRAAAVMQLEHFAQKLEVPLVKHGPGADPAAVCFDAIQSAIAKKIDVVILDSAGRLEHKLGLMHELKKIHQSCDKSFKGAPHYTLLNIDASLGQSALVQAKAFHEASPLSGVILSKFDGSPKGGVLLSLSSHMKLPIAFLGTGENLDDLALFEANSYLEALFKQGS
jgi:fused signal recognition particle receptor